MNRKDNFGSISGKNFISICVMLFLLLILSIALTYILPKGEFGRFEDGLLNYSDVTVIENAGGIPLLRGLMAPVLVFFSPGGKNLIFLSLFILSVNASFYLMRETGGIRAIVDVIVKRFEKRQRLLLVVMSFLFFCFGSFLGLFEEVLVLLPIVCSICLMAGFDSFTGFLCCTVSCGFGFAAALTNPFTVITASELIGTGPMEHIGFRFIIFVTMFALLQGFIFLYTSKLKNNRGISLTYEYDRGISKRGEKTSVVSDGKLANTELTNTELTDTKLADAEPTQTDGKSGKKILRGYTVFLTGLLVLITVCSMIPVLRNVIIVILTLYSLVFGVLTAFYVSKEKKGIPKKALRGLVLGCPAVLIIALSGSVKYVFEEGRILPVMVSVLNHRMEGQKPLVNAFFIFLVILILEFFISSSTAKAVFVMGILSMLHTGIGKGMSVLLFIFGDGYTNVFFPTSPVLLIALSMIGVEYFKWVKKSLPLFLCTFALLAGFIVIGVCCGF